MPNEQKPSVGRIVHYYPKDYPTEAHSARISQLLDDGVVYLHVDWIHGSIPCLRFEAAFSETPKPGHWSWPPRV